MYSIDLIGYFRCASSAASALESADEPAVPAADLSPPRMEVRLAVSAAFVVVSAAAATEDFEALVSAFEVSSEVVPERF